MGTIIERKSKTGGKRYTAQIRMKHQGEIVVNEAKTFAQRRFAVAWLKRQEILVDEAGGALAFSQRRKSAAAQSATGESIIDAYLKSLHKTPGRPKLQTLKMLKRFDIAKRDWRTLTSTDSIAFGAELPKGVQPAPNDLDTASMKTFALRPRQPQTVVTAGGLRFPAPIERRLGALGTVVPALRRACQKRPFVMAGTEREPLFHASAHFHWDDVKPVWFP